MPLQLSLFDSRPIPPEPPVVVARGPRAAEALLLDGIEALLDEVARDPALLALPVRIVVPSRSLREHVAAALAARRGRGAAGVVVQTLHGLASEVLARSGEAAPKGRLLFDLLAQRFARLEPALARPLDGLVDGYGAVAGSVRDLLDAGLTAEHADAAEEALAASGRASRGAIDRARALVRIAARVDRAAERLSIGRVSHLFRRAVERLAADPDAALPTRALRVHGFADATGVATDLLARLLKRPGARLVLDRPPDPARPGATESGFTERLSQALAPGARLDVPPPAPMPAQDDRSAEAPVLFMAPGAEAEAREVAVRIGALLAAGAIPERIGVVARDLSPYRRALRRHLGRLGIPFSGVGERGSSTPSGRRAAALLDLLEGREASPCDRWLDAVVSLPRSGADRRMPVTAPRRVDLRLAIRALGAGRLSDLAALSPGELARLLRNGRFALPIRQGLREVANTEADPDAETEPSDEANEEDSPRASRAMARSVAGSELDRARAAGASLAARFAAWPAEASAAEHLARLAVLLGEELGWSAGRSRLGSRVRNDVAPVYRALDDLAAEIPPGFPLTLPELARLLHHGLAESDTDPLGGAGGGVQVLSVTEARGRTFERLFVLGLNRDVFPRPVREDPLFPDSLRAVLCGPGGDGVLPDVPIKASGFDEERYLFAQLLAAAPAVTLSWQAADDDGRPLAASPLLARLTGWSGWSGAMEPAVAPALYGMPMRVSSADPLSGRPRSPRPASEEAILAGLHAGRERLRPLMPAAIAEARSELESGPALESTLEPNILAAVRLRVLDELDPDRRTPAGRAVRLLPGPYLGFLGRAPRAGADPRHRDLYVTALEAFAACPWQTFLERFLEVERTPDPLEALPGLDPLLVGNVVHAVLEEIVRRSRRGDADPAEPSPDVQGWAGREAIAVPWPAPAALDGLRAAAAERVALNEGIPLRGLARALAERARPFVAAAGEADWRDPEGPPLSLGAELAGWLEVEDGSGRRRRLRFRADRVDAGGSGLVLTDYKTGRPFSELKTADGRRRAFLRRVRAGQSLQAIAYGLGGGPGALGRYLFLRPEVEERTVEAEPEDAAAVAGFRQAVTAVLAAWDAGALFPRLVDPTGRNEPSRCKFCRVAEACLRGDSGARSRLLDYAEQAPADFSGVWRLAQGASETPISESPVAGTTAGSEENG